MNRYECSHIFLKYDFKFAPKYLYRLLFRMFKVFYSICKHKNFTENSSIKLFEILNSTLIKL